jgi:alpha-beta hydrolase superfamily lysophospholipase
LARPFYIRSGETSTFAVHHPAEGENAGSRPAVLFCPPWGWDEVASYRVRREWAGRLAAAGFPVLRFDLPATGNSGGGVEDGGLSSEWVTSLVAAATWLAEQDGTAVAAIGFGLGGLLALLALARGAPISSLALWGAPAAGRRFVRETRAFSAMQSWYADDAAEFDPGVPEGWLEAGGFALAPETLAELGALAPALGEGSALRRALVLDRDGVAPDPKLAALLEAAGAKVTASPGHGWGDFISHPERAILPREVAAELERWLLAPSASDQAAAPPPAAAVEASPSIELDSERAPVRETALALGFEWGSTVGVLAEPVAADDEVDSDLCAVFLNAGAVRMTGPNRLWVETARRWAGRGLRSLRLDLEGIGEADGEPGGELQVADFYVPRYGGEVKAVLDELERRGAGRRFVLVGLCAGGYWAFREGVADPRVVAVMQVNAGALRWHTDLLVRREAQKTARAFDPRWRGKVLHGEIGARRILAILGSFAVSALRNLRTRLARAFGRDAESSLLGGIEADLDTLRDRGTPVLIAFSGEEPLGIEVERDRLAGRGARWPNVEFASLPGTDHTLRPLAAQRAVSGLLDRQLERVVPTAEARSR